MIDKLVKSCTSLKSVVMKGAALWKSEEQGAELSAEDGAAAVSRHEVGTRALPPAAKVN